MRPPTCSCRTVSQKKVAVLLDFVQITSTPPPPLNLDNLYHFFLTPMCQKIWAGVSPSPSPAPNWPKIYKYFDLKSLERFCKSFEDSKHFSVIVSILTCSSLVNLSYILVYCNSSRSLLSVGWLDQVVNNKSIKPQWLAPELMECSKARNLPWNSCFKTTSSH